VDYLHLPDGSLGVCVGDVCGHGLGPALIMAQTRAYLRAIAHETADVSEIVARLNAFLVGDLQQSHFVTLFLARIDLGARTFDYASAGHPAAHLLDASGAVTDTLELTGLPLGLFPDRAYGRSGPFPLEPGGAAVLLTDGVLEARAPDGAFYGEERALDVVRGGLDQPARAIVQAIHDSVTDFQQGAPLRDDVSVVVCKVS
jgi:sigma-B regulation protein RsbU (phosphoserine phosphatase)